MPAQSRAYIKTGGPQSSINQPPPLLAPHRFLIRILFERLLSPSRLLGYASTVNRCIFVNMTAKTTDLSEPDVKATYDQGVPPAVDEVQDDASVGPKDAILPAGVLDPIYDAKARVLNHAVSPCISPTYGTLIWWLGQDD